MTRRRVLCGLAAAPFALALIWWAAWCKHALDGWMAGPIALTVGLPLYAATMLLVVCATRRD